MQQSGITTEGMPVIAEVFDLVGTHGTPLEVVLEYFKSKNMVIDWVDYCKAALADGHKRSTIKARIVAAIGDVYGTDYARNFKQRLDKIL